MLIKTLLIWIMMMMCNIIKRLVSNSVSIKRNVLQVFRSTSHTEVKSQCARAFRGRWLFNPVTNCTETLTTVTHLLVDNSAVLRLSFTLVR